MIILRPRDYKLRLTVVAKTRPHHVMWVRMCVEWKRRNPRTIIHVYPLVSGQMTSV